MTSIGKSRTIGRALALCAAIGAPGVLQAKSLLPGMLYEIDPTLPASRDPLGAAPGIQLDEEGGIVAMRLAGSSEVLHRGYGKSVLMPNGLDGKPVIVNPAGATPGGWDSLVFDPVAADPIVARDNQPFTVAAVVRRHSLRSCDLMKLYATNGTHVHFLGHRRWDDPNRTEQRPGHRDRRFCRAAEPMGHPILYV